MYELFYDHVYFYKKFLIGYWNNLSPGDYGALLSVVAIFGWVLMKSNFRK